MVQPNFSTKHQTLIEIAPTLYATPEGQWVAEPAFGARIIKGFDLPIPDPGVKQQLLQGEDSSTQDKISDALGLWGKTKDVYDDAWAVGSAAVEAYTGVTWVISLLEKFKLISSGPDPVNEALKKIVALLDDINKTLKLHFAFDVNQAKSQLDDGVDKTTVAALAFLGQQKPEDREELEKRLMDLHGPMNLVIDTNFSPQTLVEPYDLWAQYKNTDWINSIWYVGWDLEHMPFTTDLSVSNGVLVVGEQWDPFRWNYIGWAPYIARATSLAILSHKLVNPATRTAGKYRNMFREYADGLRALAMKVAASIQITREIEFPLDARWAGPKKFSFDILADGWPVGAVDTITGASIFTPRWKPAEHGFPLLAAIKGKTYPSSSPDKLPWLYAVAFVQAKQKADFVRRATWFKLIIAHPAIGRLLKLADLFEQMATPPDTSEIVLFSDPKWTGKRTSAGETKVTVGGVFCEFREFTTVEFHVKQRVSLNTTLQLDLFKTSTHEITYRVLLESYPHWATKPDRMWRKDVVELSEGTGTAQLNVPSFDLDIEKPFIIKDYIKTDESLADGQDSNKKLAYYWHVPAVDSQATLFQLPNTGSLSVDQPIEERSGIITAGPMAKMNIPYKMTKTDGHLALTLENTPKQNGLLWLVIEEDVGNAGLSAPVIRTGVRLAMIGKERYWSPGYFAHKNHCSSETSKALFGFLDVAKERGIPVPQPDIHRDVSYEHYAARLQKLVRRRK